MNAHRMRKVKSVCTFLFRRHLFCTGIVEISLLFLLTLKNDKNYFSPSKPKIKMWSGKFFLQLPFNIYLSTYLSLSSSSETSNKKNNPRLHVSHTRMIFFFSHECKEIAEYFCSEMYILRYRPTYLGTFFKKKIRL